MHYMCFESSAVFLSLCFHCSDSALGYTTKGLSQSCSDKHYHVFLWTVPKLSNTSVDCLWKTDVWV